jgi:hypothetical protein
MHRGNSIFPVPDTCTAPAPASFVSSCAEHVCGSSVFSILGFGAGATGAVGAICGILACVASSILMCCAPKSVNEGSGKFMAVRTPTTPTLTHASPNNGPHTPSRRRW